MKKPIIVFAFLIFCLPAFAAGGQAATAASEKKAAESTEPAKTEEQKEPDFDPSTLTLDLTRYYRYVNQHCEFSFQLPEAPRTQVIWSEMELPTQIVGQPRLGEIGEHVIYHRKSLDGVQYFNFDAYCLYPAPEALSGITVSAIENELNLWGEELKLRNLQITANEVSENFLVATASGLTIQSEDGKADIHYLQYLKGPKSLLIMKFAYNAEASQFDQAYEYVQNSLIYKEKD